MELLHAILALIPLSSIISAMVIWFSQRKIERKIEISEQKEQSQRELQLIIIQTVNASMAVSEALALIYQETPETPHIRELEEALNKMYEVRRKQELFFQQQTVQHLNKGGDGL